VFNKVGLIAKRDDARVGEMLTRFLKLLAARGIDVVIDESSEALVDCQSARTVDRETLADECDLAVILGGDGTFLNAARSLSGKPIRLLGINMGRVGFLTDVVPEEMNSVVAAVLDGDFTEEQRFLLSTRVIHQGDCVLEVSALNDVVAHNWRIARLLEFETYINSKLVNQQRADGLIVATPTGSTAYALSSGGPILHPGIDALVLVPVCPHTLTSRPLVVQGDSNIEIVLSDGEQPEAQLTCDGQTTMKLSAGDRIQICKNSDTLSLIHPSGYDFYATLRTKLNRGRG
jgi:NAD+ kinase